MEQTYTKLKRFRFPLLLEFTIIVIASLGYFVFSALQYTDFGDHQNTTISYGDHEVMQLLIYEIGALLFVFAFLRFQGKRFKNLGFSISLDHLTHGLILFIANYFIYLILFRLFGSFIMTSGAAEHSTGAVAYSINISIVPLILFSIINPVFEEFILVGYIVSAIGKRFGLAITVILSVVFRLSFHIYQGPIILLSILPMGIIFTIYYWHKRSIIPLIVGHGIMDFLSFYVFMIFQQNN